MNWERALAFINAADPAFSGLIKGVPPADIAAAEAGCGIRLPRAYREFVLLMGADSGRFSATTATQTHQFYEVMALLPDEDYPLDRYFRISFASDDSLISPPDYFLDLSRSDGEDAPLVTFEGGGSFNPDDVRETGFTFGEQVTERIFRFFEFGERSTRERIFIHQVRAADAPARMTAAIELLTLMRLDFALAALPRVACLSRPDASVIVAIREPNELVKVNISSDTAAVGRALADQVVAGLPGAEHFRFKNL